jgi:hypothetical protein
MSYQQIQQELLDEQEKWETAFANVGRLQGPYIDPAASAEATWIISGFGRPTHRAERTTGAWKYCLRENTLTQRSRSRSEFDAKSRS